MGKADFKFQVVNPTEYECEWRLPVSGKTLERAFMLAKWKYAKQIPKYVDDRSLKRKWEETTRFDIPPGAMQLTLTGMKSHIRDLKRQVMEQGNIKILTMHSKGAHFEKSDLTNKWMVYYKVGGEYVEK